MDQQTIDKLLEIKKLYEDGILTKEEMEAEKSKILHPATTPNNESTQTNSSSKKGNNKWYWIGGIGILVLIIFLLAMSGSKKNEPKYYNEDAATDSVTYDEPVTIIDDEDSEIEATETGTWAGRIVIDGGMYRNCLTSASINLVPDGNNKYHGTIKIHAGEGLNGYLEGDIIASGSDSELTIHIIEPYVAPGDNGNVFDEPEFYKPIQKNSDIFRITKQGNSYSATPLGNMKEYFDGIADEITVNKK